MTAVEWFYQRMFAKDITSVFEQAKEMEKQQISRAYFSGWDEELDRSGEQYYNETFNK